MLPVYAQLETWSQLLYDHVTGRFREAIGHWSEIGSWGGIIDALEVDLRGTSSSVVADRHPQPAAACWVRCHCSPAPSGARRTSATVIVLPTTGVVDQIMSNYLREGIDRAVARRAPRPWSSSSTLRAARSTPRREIVSAELNADGPGDGLGGSSRQPGCECWHLHDPGCAMSRPWHRPPTSVRPRPSPATARTSPTILARRS